MTHQLNAIPPSNVNQSDKNIFFKTGPLLVMLSSTATLGCLVMAMWSGGTNGETRSANEKKPVHDLVVWKHHFETSTADDNAKQLVTSAHGEERQPKSIHGTTKLSDEKRERYIEQLRHPDPKVAIEGISSLAHRGAITPALGQAILAIIKSTQDVELKKTGVWAISGSGMENVESELTALGLTESNGRVGSRVIDALVTLKNDDARDGLISLMNGAQVNTVRRRSAMMLGMVSQAQPDVVKALTVVALKDTDNAVRSAAIRALGVSTSTAAMDALKTISEAAPSAASREAARNRLVRTQARLGSSEQLLAQFHTPQHPRMATAKQHMFHDSHGKHDGHH